MDISTTILNAIIEITSDLVYAKDLDGGYLLVNNATARAIGRPVEEIPGKHPIEFFPLEVVERAAVEDRRVIASGQTQLIEEPYPLRTGERILQTYKSPMRDEHGRIIGVVGIARDVTDERRQAELDKFQSAADTLLAGSVDYEARLRDLAQLAVPLIADWCAVHMLAEDGSLRELVVAHHDPARLELARELQRRYPPDPESPLGLAHVFRTGRSQLMPLVTAEMLERMVVAPEQLELIRQVGLTSYMIVPLGARGRTLGAISFVSTSPGRTFNESDLRFAESLAGRAAIHIDNARLYRELQRLNESLEQRVQERTAELAKANQQLQSEIAERRRVEELTGALFRISTRLSSTLDVDTILEETVRETTALINAESGFAGLRTPAGMSVRTYFDQGRSQPFEHTWAPGEGMPGWVLQHKQPYLTNDAPHDTVMRHELPINAAVRTAVCTPILDMDDEVIGFFDIRNKRDGQAFTLQDQQTLMALAPLTSIALQNALSYQKVLRAESALKSSLQEVRALAAKVESVREDERAHIARELHDELGQALTALKFDLAWLAGRLAPVDESLRDKARSITSQIDTTIKTVRRLSTELRPGMLDDFGLAASIEWHAQEFQERTGIQCDLSDLKPEPVLTRAQATALFRIFQETMTNVARHANAARVHIRLRTDDDVLVLQVQDDGRGMQLAARAGGHSLGLVGMRERAELLTGTLEIASAPGSGTTVTVRLPLAQPAANGSYFKSDVNL